MAIVPGIEHLVASLREKDPSVVRHSERAARYALCLGHAMGLKSGQLFSLRRGGILHDIGKLSVPQPILDKPGPLTADEWAIIHLHPQEGYRYLLDRIEAPALDVVLYHHERFDGRGYPARLGGEAIPVLARVFAIADAFDVMTSARAVRSSMALDDAREEVLLCAGTQFDPVLVEIFSEIFDEIVLAHGEAETRLQPLSSAAGRHRAVRHVASPRFD